ncbi:hypothetical protein GALMADRAFT_153781 [Galerina marginata CBS 339.88]|uniref:Uncharacterized protein n=1 Tax=Galerina marginata (strain CBS 339.88) TaxID=685588 RepID=A0A067TCL3_GALM3|nr:hypothetical protein GALMADRAFT_153781 [Galerina marginata CBS 339.88]
MAHTTYTLPCFILTIPTFLTLVTTYYKPPLGGPYLPDSPLKARGGTLTIGYGSGGVAPLSYDLPGSQDLSVGFLKLFAFTQPLDFFTRPQPSGHDESMPMHKIWGTLLVPLIVRRYRIGTPPTGLANVWPHVHRITHRTTSLPERLTEARNPK